MMYPMNSRRSYGIFGRNHMKFITSIQYRLIYKYSNIVSYDNISFTYINIENRIGGGGASIYGRIFPDESYCISHNRRGVLSMANDGRHTNGSQFIITLQPALWMDYYYVAFGLNPSSSNFINHSFERTKIVNSKSSVKKITSLWICIIFLSPEELSII
ncbi:uncharacterized protein LOC126455973 [Schistocerca serialis cubense]|uniref:uncharacterized protein LOC126455973 n=1 Tax=Schistocerca serialis cubense TaxID=2023355 RepID=UPI00214EF838|nr:uncharacterized protein LOC126455973 [Schistocerca serialis cubense]